MIDTEKIIAAIPRLRGAVYDLSDAAELENALDLVADLVNERTQLCELVEKFADSFSTCAGRGPFDERWRDGDITLTHDEIDFIDSIRKTQ